MTPILVSFHLLFFLYLKTLSQLIGIEPVFEPDFVYQHGSPQSMHSNTATSRPQGILAPRLKVGENRPGIG
jgi:hypothetical protein